MSFSQKQNIIFYIALTLSAIQVIQYLSSGGALNHSSWISSVLVMVHQKKAACQFKH